MEKRKHKQHFRMLVDVHGLAVDFNTRQQCAMRKHHAFRRSRCSAGVQQQRRVGFFRFDNAWSRRTCQQRLVSCAFAGQAFRVHLSTTYSSLSIGQFVFGNKQQTRRSLRNQRRQHRARKSGRKRRTHCANTRARHGQLNEYGRIFRGQRHNIAFFHAARAQSARKLRNACIKLLIRESTALGNKGGTIGAQLSPLQQYFVNTRH